MSDEATPANAEEEKPYEVIRFEFTGKAYEFFLLWLKNIVLTILTLGIYSAWAKVSETRYLYQHTRLRDNQFDFHGKAFAILLGRVLLLLLASLVGIAAYINADPLPGLKPVISIAAVYLGFILLYPWLIMKTLTYRAANTSFAGARFRFTPRTLRAYGVYSGILLSLMYMHLVLGTTYVFQITSKWVIVPLIILAVFLLLHFLRAKEKLKVENLYYGPFQFQLGASRKTYLNVISGFVGASIFLSLITAFIAALYSVSTKNSTSDPSTVTTTLFFLWGLLTYLVYYAVYQANIINGSWNNASVDQVFFNITYDTGSVVVLYLKSFILCVITLGLYFPIAKFQIFRQRVVRSYLVIPPDYDLNRRHDIRQALEGPTEQLLANTGAGVSF